MTDHQGAQILETPEKGPPEQTRNTCRPDEHKVPCRDVYPGVTEGGYCKSTPPSQQSLELPLKIGPPEEFLCRAGDKEEHQQDDPVWRGAAFIVDTPDLLPGKAEKVYGDELADNEG